MATIPAIVDFTTLSADLSTYDVSRVALAALTNVRAGTGLFVGMEAMTVLVVGPGNLVRVTRGVNGTAAGVHKTGDKVWIGPSPAVLGSGPFWASSPVVGSACNINREQYDTRINVHNGEVWKCQNSIWVGTSPYDGRILADGATAYWPLDDAPGSLTARAMVGAAGTPHGVVFGSQGAIGASAAAEFDGISDWISLPNVPVTSFTVEMWIRNAAALNVGTGTYKSSQLLRRKPSAGTAGTIELSLIGTATGADLNLRVVNTVGTIFNLKAANVSVNARHFVAATYDGANIRVYVDGALKAGPLAVTMAADTPPYTLELGRFDNVTNYFQGWIQNVAIYPLALAPAKIADHYAMHAE